MFRLCREVRFAINDVRDDQLLGTPSNSYGGFPTVTGLAHWFSFTVTLMGDIDLQTSYLRNIKEIDDVVRRRVVPLIEGTICRSRFGGGAGLLGDIFALLRDAWPGTSLDSVQLSFNPFLTLSARAEEFPMIRLSQKFEFSASHRLHNPALSHEMNRACFGKCNNAAGHGHNYEVQVTVTGKSKPDGTLAHLPDLERIVTKTVIDRFDHKHLNQEVPEFAELNPTVENIAKIIFGLLKPVITNLASITVWETPKTWCEFSDG